MQIQSLTGPVTQTEINSFKTYMATQVPAPTPWGALSGSGHNEWADGASGSDLEAFGMMYEVTGDITILNSMISWADTCTSERNDLMSSANGGQRVMWTGTIDKVWCPNAPTITDPGYAGCENVDTEGHLAYCALEILGNPAIWNTTVPDGDPFGYGATYLQRAENYVAKCDEGNEEYSLNYFIQAGTNLIRPPTAAAWVALDENVTANNRQMMFDGGFERLAEAHAILADNPSLEAQYNAIVNASTNECLNGMEVASYVNGQMVYKWGYYPTNVDPPESDNELANGVHGAYDMVGIYRAFSNGSYGMSRAAVAPFANAEVDVMNIGPDLFSENVDASGTSPTNYMAAQWLLLADWNPSVYTVCAAADVASRRYESTPIMDATILWLKNRLYGTSLPGIYEIQCAASSQAVNVSGSSMSFSAPVIQSNYNSNPAQLWTFVASSGSYYRIQNLNSGQFINVSGASTAAGASIIQYPSVTTGNDQWKPVQNGNGTYTFYNLNSGMVLDDPGSSTTQGTQFDQQPATGGAGQQFNLINSPPSISPVANPTVEAGATGTSNSFVVNELVTTGSVTLTVTATSANTALVPNSGVVVTFETNPWTSADIGAVPTPGSAAVSATSITVMASGSDIWSATDYGHYVSDSMTGNGQITARVDSVQDTNVWAKAGVMMRTGTDPACPEAFMCVSASSGLLFETRATEGGATSEIGQIASIAAPCWVQLIRTGTTFTGLYAPDAGGVPGAWTAVGSSPEVNVGSTFLTGLAVTSHNTGALCTAVFDHVSGEPEPNYGLAITPAPSVTGSTAITLSACAGTGTTTETFLFAVNPPPGITAIANQQIAVSTTSGPLAFTLTDQEFSPGSLTVTATSSNLTLVPLSGITFSGTGASRFVTVTPATNLTGSSTITLTVSDGTLATSTNFILSVAATPLQAWDIQYFGTSNNIGNAADLANPAGDGICNLVKFALGMNPLVNSLNGLPVVSTTNGNLQIHFNRNLSATDTAYNIEASSDMVNWTTIASLPAGSSTWSQPGASVTDINGAVTVVDGTTIKSQPRRFLELTVTGP